MNRLDEIEREHRTVLADYTDKGCGPEVDPEGEQYTARDVLALVAVARAAARYRTAWLELHNYAPKAGKHYELLCEELVAARRALDDALAPLLAEVGTGHRR
jgi:hypothetical protein